MPVGRPIHNVDPELIKCTISETSLRKGKGNNVFKNLHSKFIEAKKLPGYAVFCSGMTKPSFA